MGVFELYFPELYFHSLFPRQLQAVGNTGIIGLHT